MNEAFSVQALLPKGLPKRAPQGIRVFTVARQDDESGVPGTGFVIEGVVFATGECVVHWLTPPPKGSIAIWADFDDFVKIHVKPHMSNGTIVTFADGEQLRF